MIPQYVNRISALNKAMWFMVAINVAYWILVVHIVDIASYAETTGGWLVVYISVFLICRTMYALMLIRMKEAADVRRCVFIRNNIYLLIYFSVLYTQVWSVRFL